MPIVMKKIFTFIAALVVSTFGMNAQNIEYGDNLNKNSDFEGDEFEWVAAKPSLLDGAANEKIFQGADVAKCIKSNEEGKFLEIVSGPNPSVAWDAQVWIKLPDDIETGEHVIISFRYRADIDDEGVESLNVGTQGHKAPGEYLNNTGLGDLGFTREWQTYTNEENPFVVPASQKSIAFNLSVNGAYTAAFQFDDLVIRREKKDETLVDYWKPVVTNGDLENDGCPNYIISLPGKGQFEAVPAEGEGVDGSAGIKITVPAKEKEDYDSQFFIKLNEPIPAGDVIRVSFKYKQDVNLDETALVDSWRDHKRIGAQAHAMPGSYITWNAGFYELEGTTEWKIYEGDFQISEEASPSGNFQTIAFNLSITDFEYNLWFDDFVVKHKVKVPAGTNPAQLALEEYLAELDGRYSGMTAFAKANVEIIDAFQQAYSDAQAAGDGDDFEALYDDLIKAESKYTSSVKDYANFTNYMNMIQEKVDLTKASFPDLSAKLQDEYDALTDAYNEATIGRDKINEIIDNQKIYDMVSAGIMPEIKAGDDLSALITNPNYSFGNTGWNGGVTVNYGAAERYHTGFDVNQTIKGLKKGAYVLQLNGFQRIDENGYDNAQLYANAAAKLIVNRDLADDGVEEGDQPNDMASAAAAFEKGYYSNELSFVLTEDGDIKFGVKGTDTNIWVIWDQFRLIYKGEDKSVMAQAILDQIDAVENVEFNLEFDELLNTATADKEADLVFEAGLMAMNIDAASEAEINAMIQKLVDMIDEMNEVAKVVKTVNDAYTPFANAYDQYYDDAMPAVQQRCDKVADICNSDEGYLSLSTDDLKEFASELVELAEAIKIKAAALDATDAAPFDFTYLFVDPDFEDYAEVGANANYPGWKGSGFGTGGGTAGPVGERWNQANGFDTYVEFNYLPEGTYEISCDGAYRVGGSVGSADEACVANDSISEEAAYLYAIVESGKREVALHNIYTGKMTEAEVRSAWSAYLDEEDAISDCDTYTDSEGNTYYFPNQLLTADRFMKLSHKFQNNKVAFNVGKDGKARVGIARYKGQGNNWTFVDNFKLTYFGTNSVTPIEDIVVAKPSTNSKGIYTISGVRVLGATKAGLYIINGKKVVVK